MFSIKKTCEILGITRPTFYSLIEKEKLQCCRDDRGLGVTKELVEAYLDYQIRTLEAKLEQKKTMYKKHFGK